MENIDYRIDNAERTGYPALEESARITCCLCGENIYGGAEYYDFAGDIVCDKCEMEYILENIQRTCPYGMEV